MVSLVKARKKAKERKENEVIARALESAEGDVAVVSAKAAVAETPKPPESAAESAVHTPDSTLRTPDATPRVEPRPSGPAVDKLEEFKRSANVFQRDERGRGVYAQQSVDQLELLLFVIAGEQYALLIEKIIEIISPRTATRVPNADESVVGIISLRGTIVSILDIRRKLGHADQHAITEDSRIIVVENEGETAGFLVDRVLRVIRVEPSEIESHPIVAASEQSEFIRGVFQHNEKLSIFLDLERLLRF